MGTIQIETGVESEGSPETFILSITPNLARWATAQKEIQDIEDQFFGPAAVVDSLVERLTPYLIRTRTSVNFKFGLNGRFAGIDRTIAICRSEFKKTFSMDNKAFSFFIKEQKRDIQPEEYKQIYEDLEQQRTLYREKLTSPQEERGHTHNQLKQHISSWIQSDFNALFELLDITASDEETSQALLTFLSQNRTIISDNLFKPNQKELEKPDRKRLLEFLDHLGIQYYQNSRSEQIWANLEFFLPLLETGIRSMYENDMNPKKRQEALFAPILNAIYNTNKTLPPLLKDRYSTYISRLQEEALASLHGKMAKLRLPPNDKEYQPNLTTQLETAARAEKDLLPSPTRYKEPKPIAPYNSVLINGETYKDQESVQIGLEKLFKLSLKSYKQNDLDAYVRVLSKLIGAVTNAPKYELRKLTAFPQIQLGDGTFEPPLRLRLSAKEAPRLIIAFHQKSVIVALTFQREDNTYNQLMRRGLSIVSPRSF